MITAPYGMKVGFAMGLGFRGHGAVDRHAFRTEALKFLINTGYQLACYLVMGAILAVSGRY